MATGESGARFETQLAPAEGAEALGAARAAIDGGDAAAAFDAIAGAAANGELVPGGVDVSRVPALVVVRPRERSRSGIPVASVSYGFRGPASAEQAVRDALYDGRQDLPYHPK